MTFADLQAAVYEETGDAGTSAAVQTRVKRYLNEALHAVLNEPGLARLVDSDAPYVFASVATQARYVFPSALGRIVAIRDTTNRRPLGVMALESYRRIEPDPTVVSGVPECYVPLGRVAVAVQPSNASAIYALSTSSSDTGTVYLEGLITGGYRQIVSQALGGTSAVQIGSLSSWTDLEDVYLSKPAVGTVTILEDSGVGTVLATIEAGETRPQYYGIDLWPTPAGVYTYAVDYRKPVVDLVNDGDEPLIPREFHPLLVKYATWQEWAKKADTDRVVVAKTQYDTWLSRLKFFTQSLPAETPVMGRRSQVGRSRLGAWYPADSY